MWLPGNSTCPFQNTTFIISWMVTYCLQPHTMEMPEPGLFLLQHGAQIGGIWGFPISIKIRVVHQVHMLPASTAVWAWRYTRVRCGTVREDCGCICLPLSFLAWSATFKYPQFDTRGWQHHYTGALQGLGSALYRSALTTHLQVPDVLNIKHSALTHICDMKPGE